MKNHTPRLFAPLVFCALLISGCCGKGCSKIASISKELEGPDEKEGARQLEEYAKHDKKFLEQICGVSTAGLKNLVIKKKTSTSGFSIEGTPVEGVAAKAAEPKGGGGSAGAAPVNVKKALVCAAEVTLFWDLKEEKSGDVWTLRRVEVETVTTPGAEYKRPPSRHG